MSLHSVSLKHKLSFHQAQGSDNWSHALAEGPSPPGINWTRIRERVHGGAKHESTYHADVVSIQEKLRKFDLSTGVVAERLLESISMDFFDGVVTTGLMLSRQETAATLTPV